jgi:hypothetical protein
MAFSLVPADQLIATDQVAQRFIAREALSAWRLLEADLRIAYGRYALFSSDAAISEVGLSQLSAEDAFYNRYYWILVFAKRYRLSHGYDAGMEQQAFQVLESAPTTIDWSAVEDVAKLAEQA